MPIFSDNSLSRLNTCHADLQEVFHEVIKHWDCSILEGQRTIAKQADLLLAGKTKVEFGKHNVTPLSWAVDVVPYPIDWIDTKRFYHLAGIVIGISSQLGINIRWGGNWKQSKAKLPSGGFLDLPHYELIGPGFTLKGVFT